MNTEPKIGDVVWVFYYETLMRCFVVEKRPPLPYGPPKGNVYKLSSTDAPVATQDTGLLFFASNMHKTPQSALKAEIRKSERRLEEARVVVHDAENHLKAIEYHLSIVKAKLEQYK